MSQSDRLLSLSLDDIIKLRRSRRGNSQASGTARNRGQQRRGSNAQNRAALSARNQVQSRGQWNRRGRGTQRGQLQRGIVRGNQRFQRSGYEPNYQRQGRQDNQQTWSNPQILVSRGPRSANRPQRGRSRGRAQGITRQATQPRVSQIQATQVARNRIRQAANLLLQRKIQLQQLQMLNQRGGRRGSQTTRGRLARGSIRNERMVARASALQKINRAQRTRQEQQNHMLSVSIENERALECEGFALPPMMVVNQPVERTFVAPQRSLVQPFARNRIPVEEEVPVPFVSPSGRRLTLHERFSHF